MPSPLLCKILDAVFEKFDVLLDAEVTVEANPGTLTPQYLRDLKNHGVNRLSMGLQTTHTHLLKSISRIHTFENLVENYNNARAIGFDNINIDLMFALPVQKFAHWQETLNEIMTLSPEHISAYSLTPAENTPLYNDIENSKVTLPDDKLDREMYHYARTVLATAGYRQYEISNFAKPNKESRHNINCWKRVPYIGFGLGAHSFDGKRRWSNTEDMSEYISYKHSHAAGSYICAEPPADAFRDELTPEDAQSEKIILSLRLTEGIPLSEIPSRFTETTQNLIKDGLLIQENQNIKLTPHGMDFANRVFTAFM